MRKPKKIDDLLNDLTDHGSVLKGSYGDYYVYRKDWLLEHLEQEFCLLERYRDLKKVDQKEIKNILEEAKKINKTPFSTKINEDLGILGN